MDAETLFDPETLLASGSSDPMLGKSAEHQQIAAAPPIQEQDIKRSQPPPSGSFIVLQSGTSPGGGPGSVTQLGNISVSSLAPGQGARAAASRLTAVMGRPAGSAPGNLARAIISPAQASSGAPVRMLGSATAVRTPAGGPGTLTLTSAQAQQMGLLSPSKGSGLDAVRSGVSPKRIVIRSSPGQPARVGAGSLRLLGQSGPQLVRVVGSAAAQQPLKIAIAPAPAAGQRLLLPAGQPSAAQSRPPQPAAPAPAPAPAPARPQAHKAQVARSSGRGGGDGSQVPQIRPRKPCNCTKSQCLKLYCDCFASGEFCNNCNCANCMNSLNYEEERQRAIRACLDRNPFAFKPKIGKSDNETRKHQKGCNCKKSGCLKNYCECYEAKIFCSSHCKCLGCKNYETAGAAPLRSGTVSAADGGPAPEIAAAGRLVSGGRRLRPAPVRVTQEVVAATLSCLLTEAAAAGPAGTHQAQRRLLAEFGRCMAEIIDYGSKRAADSTAWGIL